MWTVLYLNIPVAICVYILMGPWTYGHWYVITILGNFVVKVIKFYIYSLNDNYLNIPNDFYLW